MKRIWFVAAALVIAFLPLAAQAQEDGVYGPSQGDWELTLSGSGDSDNDFEAGGFGFEGSLGYYYTEALEVVIRQGLSFDDHGDSRLAGSTRVGLDYHFDLDRLRPFIGANIGGVYGDGDVNDSFIAGLDGGLKWYVKPETFILVGAEYQWLFDDASGADESFDDGRFVYTLGIGLNF